MIMDWKAAAATKKASQNQSLPSKWRFTPDQLPLESTLNVMNVIEQSGILTKQEMIITELDDLKTLLGNLAQGLWSATEVTLAYCKRATLAQQLVSTLSPYTG